MYKKVMALPPALIRRMAGLAALCFVSAASVNADMVLSATGDTLYGNILLESDSGVVLDGEYGEQFIPIDSVARFVVDERKIAKKVRLGLAAGEIHLFRNGAKIPPVYGLSLLDGDSLATGAGGSLELFVYPNDFIRLGSETSLSIATFLLNKRSRLFARRFRLARGHVVCLVRNAAQPAPPVEILTPSAAVSAEASLIGVAYSAEGSATTVDIALKTGEVGFRSTRMDIGQVVLRDNETAVLSEGAGGISEDAVPDSVKTALLAQQARFEKKSVLAIAYPKRPLGKIWKYAGLGALLAAGGMTTYLLVSSGNDSSGKTISVKTTW